MFNRRWFILATWLCYFALAISIAGPLISATQKVLAQTSAVSYTSEINEFSMCGYCDLLALSPAVIFFTLVALAFIPKQAASLHWFVAEVWLVILQPHAAPRAPPAFT